MAAIVDTAERRLDLQQDWKYADVEAGAEVIDIKPLHISLSLSFPTLRGSHYRIHFCDPSPSAVSLAANLLVGTTCMSDCSLYATFFVSNSLRVCDVF